MLERNITVTLERAKEWYNNGNKVLRGLALQAFSEKELTVFDFTKIKSFEDALKYLYRFDTFDYNNIKFHMNEIAKVSKASAAMFKLNIIRKALHIGYDLHLTKDPEGSYIYYPYNQFITENSTYDKSELSLSKMKVIGKIMSEGISYNVLGGCAKYGSYTGLGCFYSIDGVGNSYPAIGFLGCATKEIAEYFSEHFGMLIMEAMYGDMIDFQILKTC